MIRDHILKIFSEQPDVYRFRLDSDKEKVISAIEGRFNKIGNVLVNKTTGAQIADNDFQAALYGSSREYLRVWTSGKYIPLFVDARTPDEKLKQSQEVEKVVDYLFEKSGFVFQGEHLQDNTLRTLVKTRIAENFLFEAGSNEGEIVFRKFHQGMFSKPFKPKEILEHFTAGLLDRQRTIQKQEEIKLALKEKIVKESALKNGDYVPSDIKSTKPRMVTKEGYMQEIDTKVEEAFERSKAVYTKKILPQQRQRDIMTEFERRALFTAALPNKNVGTLQQVNRIESYVGKKLIELDSLPGTQDLANHTTKAEQWNVSTENKTGYALPSEAL